MKAEKSLPFSLGDLPVEILSVILHSVVITGPPERPSTMSEWDNFYLWHWPFRQNYTHLNPLITIDNELTFALARVCRSFFRALKGNAEIRKSLFRLSMSIGVMGETYDGDMTTYFPVRFCTRPADYLKEYVDTYYGQFSRNRWRPPDCRFLTPFKKLIEVNNRYVCVEIRIEEHFRDPIPSKANPVAQDYLNAFVPGNDGFMLSYCVEKPESLDRGIEKLAETIKAVKGWNDGLKNTLLVSPNVTYHLRNRSHPVTLAMAEKRAEALGIPHMEMEFHNSRTMPTWNVQESVALVVEKILSDEAYEVEYDNYEMLGLKKKKSGGKSARDGSRKHLPLGCYLM